MTSEITQVIERLEEKLRWAMQSLDTVTSLTRFQDIVNTGQSLNHLLHEASTQINSLAKHKAIGIFIVDKSTSEFRLHNCYPSKMDELVKNEHEFLVKNGTFGWAIKNNHIVSTSPSNGTGTLLLHVLATRNKVYGMYLGLLDQNDNSISSMTLDILSVVFANLSMAIESYETYNLIHRYNEQLEADIKERTKDLEASQQKAEAANVAKSAFLANMSHTLKTPLNAIIGYSEMLLEDAQDNQNEDLEQDLKRINNAGKGLLTTITDMLDYAKMEAGHIQLSPLEFTVDEMIEGVIGEQRETAKQNNNQLKSDIQLTHNIMYADGPRIKQALGQLASNGCKFTENGEITICAKNFDVDGKVWFEFSVCDTGIGIAKEKLDHLFDVFNQLDNSASKKFEGTGLGLAIARFVAEGMGGTIKVESEEGKGSCFILTIPNQG